MVYADLVKVLLVDRLPLPAMSNWTEGILALAIVVGVGVALFLFSGESLGSGRDSGPEPVVADDDAAARGEALAAQVGCLACHTIDGALGIGPTWRGLAGSNRPLDSGETVAADDEYLRQAIVDPEASIVFGFEPVMPTEYSDRLSNEEINDLVEYIKSLSS